MADGVIALEDLGVHPLQPDLHIAAEAAMRQHRLQTGVEAGARTEKLGGVCFGAAGLMLVVNPSTPVRNLEEFLSWTKNYAGPLNYGSAGNGSGGHLAGELYKLMTGVKAEHIPYKGSGPAMMDLVAGQYHYNFAGMQGAQTLVRSGKLRALAVTAPRRLAALPGLPAVAEMLPGFEVVGWYGVIGPANLPSPIVTRLHEEFVKVLDQPEVRERIVADGSEPVGSTPEDFRQFMLADLAKWAKLVKQSGAKLD